MAYVIDNRDDEEQQGGEQSLGGESGVIQAGQPGGPQQASSPTQGAGKFTDLQKYIESNRNAKFGSDVTEKVNKSFDEAQSAQQQAESGFGGEVEAGRNIYSSQDIEKAKQTPEQVSADTAAKSRVQRNLRGGYQGPQDFSGSSYRAPAYEATQKAVNLGTAAQTEAGRNALLNQMYSRPDYSAGMRNLDQALLSGSQQFSQALPQFQNRAEDVNKAYSDLLARMAGKVSQAQVESKDTNKIARQILGLGDDNRVNLESGPMAEALKKAASRRDKSLAEATMFRDRLGEVNLNKLTNVGSQKMADEYSNILGGLNPGKALQFGLNPMDYYSDKTGEIAQFTPEEYARAQALSDILGVSNTFVQPQQVSDYVGPAYQFDQDRFARDYAAKKYEFDHPVSAKPVIEAPPPTPPVTILNPHTGAATGVVLPSVQPAPPTQKYIESQTPLTAGGSGFGFGYLRRR